MNREMKIGFAVLAVLLAVLSGLLVRRFLPTTVPDEVAGQHDAAAGGDTPTVVTVEPTADAGHIPGAADPFASTADSGSSSGAPPAELPRRGYMPDQAGNAPARDRYGRELSADNTTDDIPAASPGGIHAENAEASSAPREDVAAAPRRLRMAEEAEPAADGASGGKRALKNPLRRLSAEMPLEEPDAEPLSTAGAEPELNGADLSPADLEPAQPEPAAAEPAEVEESPQAAALSDREQALETAPRSRYRSREPQEPSAAAPRRPAPPADPAPGGKYTVQPNDNLWSISEKVYGSGRYFKAIGEHNRAKYPRPDRLQVGSVLEVPPARELEDRYPSLCPKQRKSVVVAPRNVQASAQQPVVSGSNAYIVEEGDTLFDIARYELGKASRWAEIYELNREKLGGDVDYLQPGTELVMPERSPVSAGRERRNSAR